MRHGLPSASGMLFSLVLAASTVQAYGFRPDNQRTLSRRFRLPRLLPHIHQLLAA
jgi:hypothetical protein